jgi:hypothetical protein
MEVRVLSTAPNFRKLMLGCTTPERFSGDFVFLGEQGKITQRRGGRGGARRVSESWSRRSWEGVANALVFVKDRRLRRSKGSLGRRDTRSAASKLAPQNATIASWVVRPEQKLAALLASSWTVGSFAEWKTASSQGPESCWTEAPGSPEQLSLERSLPVPASKPSREPSCRGRPPYQRGAPMPSRKS